MSPSIEDIERKIRRNLKKGDVLVSNPVGKDGHDLIHYEVLDPHVTEDPKRTKNVSIRGENPAVEIREITSIGSMSDSSIIERYIDYMDIIELNNRTDLSKLQKLILEIRSLIK